MAVSGSTAGWFDALVASPLAWPLARGLERLGPQSGIPSVDLLQEVLGPSSGVRFVATPPASRRRRREQVPVDALYDALIVNRSEVPTRPGNLHDLMNALVWSTFPKTKKALHERQHALVRARFDETGRRAIPHRSADQDALAMVDEGGIVIAVTPIAEQALRNAADRRDSAPFEEAARQGAALGVVFGHALYEHIARSDVRLVWGKAVFITVAHISDVTIEAVDEQLAAWLLDAAPSFASQDAGSAALVPGVLGSRTEWHHRPRRLAV